MKICVLFAVVCYLKLYRCLPLEDSPSLTAVIREKLEEDRIQEAQEKVAESDELLKIDALSSVDAMSRRERRSLFDTPANLNEVDGPLHGEHHRATQLITKSPFRFTTAYPEITVTSTPPTTSTLLATTELPINNPLPVWLQILRLFVEPLFHSEETTPEVFTDLNATEEHTTEFTTTELQTTTTTELPTTVASELPTTGAYEGASQASSTEKTRVFVQLLRLITGPWFELETEPSITIPDLPDENAILTTSTPVVETTATSPNLHEFSNHQNEGILIATEPTPTPNTESNTLMENNDAMLNLMEPRQQQWNPFFVPHLLYFPPRLGFAGPSF